jgi:hypothetical protein
VRAALRPPVGVRAVLSSGCRVSGTRSASTVSACSPLPTMSRSRQPTARRSERLVDCLRPSGDLGGASERRDADGTDEPLSWIALADSAFCRCPIRVHPNVGDGCVRTLILGKVPDVRIYRRVAFASSSRDRLPKRDPRLRLQLRFPAFFQFGDGLIESLAR